VGLIKATFDPPRGGSYGNAAGEFCPLKGRICFVQICCPDFLVFVAWIAQMLLWWFYNYSGDCSVWKQSWVFISAI